MTTKLDLGFEGRTEKVGPALRVQSRWDRSPAQQEIDSFLTAYWRTDIDCSPLGENDPEAVVEGIPVEVTVRVPHWWIQRVQYAQRQLDDVAAALESPAHLSLDEQDCWVETRSSELGDENISLRILAELDAPGPTRTEPSTEPSTELEGTRRFRSFSGRLWGPRR